MRPKHKVRERSVPRDALLGAQNPALHTEKPGAFQVKILRAIELPRAYRDVFLLKEIQGFTFAEIAAILGISIDTALARLERARREIGHLGDSDAMEHAQ
jgi:DNA-directed RNA polymerase specialized sigma24 family protein